MFQSRRDIDIKRSGSQGAQPYSPVVPIQTGDRLGPAVFCIPGAGASVTCFLSLALSLGKQVAVYGLQPRGLDGVYAPHATVRAAAEAYANAIRKTASGRACRLVGHSFGGWVAIELAHLLGPGIVADPVVLLDTEPPSGERSEHREYGQIEMLLKLADLLEQATGKSLHLSAEFLAPLGAEERLARLSQGMITVGLLPRGSRSEAIKGMIRVFNANLNTSYLPTARYAGEVAVGRAEESSCPKPAKDERPERVDTTWHDHADTVVEFILPGNHMTLLNSPNVERVAERIWQIWKSTKR